MNKSAIRRRGYKKVDKYPVIEVLHPEAYMFEWTGGSLQICSYNIKSRISKVILDDVTYTGDTIGDIITGNCYISCASGHHICYIYMNSQWWHLYNNSSVYPFVRLPINPQVTIQGYHWGNLMFTGTIRYASASGYAGTTVGSYIYVPYDATINESDSLYKNKYVRVKYKFIEDTR